jgi:hypothetical protein
MLHPKLKPTPPNWVQELSSALAAKPREPKGDGWLTAEQFSENLGVSSGTGYKYLKRGLDSGCLEKFKGTWKSAGGIRVQHWYRPVMVKKRIT